MALCLAESQPPDIKGSGYVVASLEAALWALQNSDTFRDGCLSAVKLGDDADTTGAVYGQLAGAIYDEQGIPEEWRSKLALRQLIESYTDRPCESSLGRQDRSDVSASDFCIA